MTQRFRTLYGAHPAHLLAMLAGGLVAFVAAGPLLEERPRDVAGWFVGSAIAHDAVMVPLYVLADVALVRVWRLRPGRVPWVNFVRVPLAVSAFAFVVYAPLITRKAEQYQGATGRSTDPYLGRWLAVTGALFALSLVCWVLRRLRVGRTPAP